MKRFRVLVLMHATLVPPETLEGHSEEEINQWKMEYDVLTTLQNLGHNVQVVPVEDELKPISQGLRELKPHIAFNLLMHFHDSGIYDSAIVSWLELRKQPYTGCNPRGLLVANDKALCKKILSYHRIRHPRFFTLQRGRTVSRLPKGLKFPLFIKSSSEHASTGIAQASIVNDLDQLRERVEFVHRSVGTGALCEEYIEGRELTIGVIGNQRLETGPVWEVFMDKLPDGAPNIFTSRVKWDLEYQRRIGLRTDPAVNLPEGKEEEITRMARRLYRALGLSGFARIDMRMDGEGKVWVLEVNPNPDLCFGEDFAEAMERAGYTYPKLIQKLLTLGLRYEAPWKG